MPTINGDKISMWITLGLCAHIAKRRLKFIRLKCSTKRFIESSHHILSIERKLLPLFSPVLGAKRSQYFVHAGKGNAGQQSCMELLIISDFCKCVVRVSNRSSQNDHEEMKLVQYFAI